MAGLRLIPEAEDDVLAIRDYLALQSEDAWPRVWDALQRAFERIGASPGIGHSRPDLTDRPYRFLPVFKYVVVYDDSLRPVPILAVLHGARDLARTPRLA